MKTIRLQASSHTTRNLSLGERLLHQASDSDRASSLQRAAGYFGWVDDTGLNHAHILQSTDHCHSTAGDNGSDPRVERINQASEDPQNPGVEDIRIIDVAVAQIVGNGR